MLTWRRDKHTHSPLPLPPVSEPLIKRSTRLIYWGSVKSALGKMATQTVLEILEKRKRKEKVLHFDKSKSTMGIMFIG